MDRNWIDNFNVYSDNIGKCKSCLTTVSYLYNLLLVDLRIETNLALRLVVYRSSEKSTNQSDVIMRSDDRFLNLVIDSDSIVSNIYMLNFVLWLGFFSVSILTKILQFYPSWVFLSSYWQTSGNFVQAYFWHSVNTHIWTSLLFIYFPE